MLTELFVFEFRVTTSSSPPSSHDLLHCQRPTQRHCGRSSTSAAMTVGTIPNLTSIAISLLTSFGRYMPFSLRRGIEFGHRVMVESLRFAAIYSAAGAKISTRCST